MNHDGAGAGGDGIGYGNETILRHTLGVRTGNEREAWMGQRQDRRTLSRRPAQATQIADATMIRNPALTLMQPIDLVNEVFDARAGYASIATGTPITRDRARTIRA